MAASYLGKYIKNYSWQTLSLAMNFFSMFFVTPMLTGNKVIYGIYMLCLSTTIFLSYADLGFVGAGYKFASECHARGEDREVLRIAGFVSAILLSFAAVFSLAMAAIAVDPSIIIRDMEAGKQTDTARGLFIILAFSSPTIVLQRGLQILFGSRVEEYVMQRVNIAGSAIKIAAAFFFFRQGNYDIVGYFLFSQATTVIAAVLNLIIASRRYGFSVAEILRSIRISKDLFELMRSLAFSSLLSVICWILFYELDSFYISRFMGAERLAVYAIGLTLMSFLRGLYSILFNPFNARFNHFIGTGDIEGLRGFYQKVLEMTLPIAIIPLLILELMLRPLIRNWVGPAYESSIPLARILLASYAFSFISYPAGILLVAQKRIREANFLAIGTALGFWIGIVSSTTLLGLYSFAWFKLAMFTVSAMFYLYVSIRFLGTRAFPIFRDSVLPLALPVLVAVAACLLIEPSLGLEKGPSNLLRLIAIMGGLSVAGLSLYAVLAKPVRGSIASMLAGARSR